MAIQVPISIYELDGTLEKEIKVNAELLKINNQVRSTEVVIRLENQLKENQVYVLKTKRFLRLLY
ncbi:MAG: hypothetical protein JSV88_07935 [Candidatus Aminicenantes bacterium]|nr:MAG: hypothetical protein JSV88_07935 [Candidatus Aminicenantes bacterium]